DDVQFLAAVPEAVLGKLIAVARDMEEDLLAHEPRLMEGDDAVAVGEVCNVVDGAQFDEGDAAAGLLVDDSDGEEVAVVGCGAQYGEKTQRRQLHGIILRRVWRRACAIREFTSLPFPPARREA